MKILFNDIIMFYDTLLWLNMRSNSKNNMILGSTKLDYKPFDDKSTKSGYDSIIENLKKENLDILRFKKENK